MAREKWLGGTCSTNTPVNIIENWEQALEKIVAPKPTKGGFGQIQIITRPKIAREKARGKALRKWIDKQLHNR